MFELRPYRKNNNSLSYNPFKDFDEIERKFFEEPFGSFFRNGGLDEFKTDIFDNGDSYLLQADMPGFKKEDIHLDISGDTLTISAERHSKHEDDDKKKNYVCVERSYGQYSRQFDVSGIDTDAIKAKYEDGVLDLTLPKKNKDGDSPKRLEIE